MPHRIFAAFVLALLAASCGGGGGGAQTPQVMPLDVAVAGMAVIKVRSSPDGVTILEEKPTSLIETGPQRRITLLDPAGAERGRYSAPIGSSIIDFAQHPSGEITVALAAARTVTLVRLDRLANPGTPFPLLDPQAPGDPFYDDGGVHDDGSMVPAFTRDAVRLASVGQAGEALVVALRTGRNAVVAYRFDYTAAGGYARAWRTLVEPGLSMFGVGITSGTFDTFGQLENHFHVHLDADAAGNAVVAVVGQRGVAPVFAAHADFFHQPTAIEFGVLVTRLAADGRRVATTLIDTIGESELHGIRLGSGDVALVGRVFLERRDDGRGWVGFAADVDRTAGELKFLQVVDVDRSDVLFDIAQLASGAFLAGGSAGYTQNPTGASISEQSAPLLVILEANGTLRQRIALAAGPRQNQVRSIAPRGANWLVGSHVNGPGTHSGDANPALITADGSVRELAIAGP